MVQIPSLPNTLWVGVWTPKHLLRRPRGSFHTSSDGMTGGFWKTREWYRNSVMLNQPNRVPGHVYPTSLPVTLFHVSFGIEWEEPQQSVTCAMVKSRYIGDGHPTFNRNPYNWYIKPYYWVDDHPLLYGNNGSLDPGTHLLLASTCFCSVLSLTPHVRYTG